MKSGKIKVLIIEDEIPIQKLLSKYISSLRPEWETPDTTDCVSDTIQYFKEGNRPDLIISDIQLTDGKSFDIFSEVEISTPIIFLTAHSIYAIKAFEVNSIDFIVKPVSKMSLGRALTKFENMFIKTDYTHLAPTTTHSDINSHEHEDSDFEKSIDNGQNYRTRILVNVNDNFFSVDTEFIAYIYSQNKITFIRTLDNKEYIVDTSLNKFEEELDPKLFFRTNRSMILNIRSIERFNPYFSGKLKVKTKPAFSEDIIVGRKKASLFKSWLNK